MRDHYNNLDILNTCKKIAENFNNNISDLKNIKEEWNEKYASVLKTEIDKAYDYYNGFEPGNRIEKGNRFSQIQAQALRAMAFLKTRIDIIYAKNDERKQEVLDLLGFKHYFLAIQKRDTIALLDLLTNIEKNLSEEIRYELIKNSADQAFIDRIVKFATKLKKANESQSSLLSAKKAIAEDLQNLFLDVLSKIIEISKTLKDYYKDKPEKAKLFEYPSELINQLPTQ